MGTLIRVILADGRNLFREGLRALLEKRPTIRVVGEAEDGPLGSKLLDALPAEALILNLHPAAHAAPELVRSIARTHPDVRIIALLVKPTGQLVRDLLTAGAAGCLTQECAGAELVKALEAAAGSKPYLSPVLVELLISRYTPPRGGGRGPRSLSPREREILRRIAAGQTTRRIAADLGVGAKTVETHRRRLMAKLDRYTVAELTRYAVAQGLATPDAALDVPGA